jgi:hypothetical protein
MNARVDALHPTLGSGKKFEKCCVDQPTPLQP